MDLIPHIIHYVKIKIGLHTSIILLVALALQCLYGCLLACMFVDNYFKYSHQVAQQVLVSNIDTRWH